MLRQNSTKSSSGSVWLSSFERLAIVARTTVCSTPAKVGASNLNQKLNLNQSALCSAQVGQTRDHLWLDQGVSGLGMDEMGKGSVEKNGKEHCSKQETPGTLKSQTAITNFFPLISGVTFVDMLAYCPGSSVMSFISHTGPFFS